MYRFIIRWITLSIAIGVVVALIPGFSVVGKPPILGIASYALCLALLNATIRPIVRAISLPLTVLSVGISSLVINWLFFRWASTISMALFGVGVIVNGFWWSILASIIISLVTSLMSSVTRIF